MGTWGWVCGEWVLLLVVSEGGEKRGGGGKNGLVFSLYMVIKYFWDNGYIII